MTAVTAYIGLGANLGDRAENIRRAVSQLGQLDDTRVVKVSNLLENPAVGGPPGSPPFLNAAAELETAVAPMNLLQALIAVERTLGRHRKQKWEPRPIDLDLLLYGNEIIHNQELTVPHPLMHLRSFVLKPLAEIAPEAVHPVLGKTIAEMMGEPQ